MSAITRDAKSVMSTSEDTWQSRDEFEPIAHANKPFSLRVPALMVTRGKDGTLNLMLCMWFTPMGAEPSSFLVAVDRKTKSYELLLETNEFVIAAPDESMLDIAVYAGSVSGHAEDKWDACGLTPLRPLVGKVPLVREALANVEFEVSRMIPFDHKYDLVVGLVRACHVKSAYFRRGIYRDEANPLLWLGKESGVATGDKTATCHAAGMGKIWAADPGSPLLSRIVKRRPD
jgi:flavin reductase (DIM6/NTAB) family NADH-FMN oxidoreductase RutF